jgi:glycerol-3-phosphate O-acyltransferase/dihydroxyacetone phosphate acyltransferase
MRERGQIRRRNTEEARQEERDEDSDGEERKDV